MQRRLQMNDSRQQMVYVWQKLFNDKQFIATENINPDYTALAKSFNISAMTCDSNNQLNECLDHALNVTHPILINFIVKTEPWLRILFTAIFPLWS